LKYVPAPPQRMPANEDEDEREDVFHERDIACGTRVVV
jgi:hypothetical protein